MVSSVVTSTASTSSFLAFLKMLASKHQMHLCLEIYEEWIHLAREFQNIAHIHIYSAIPITQKQELSLKKVKSKGTLVIYKFKVTQIEAVEILKLCIAKIKEWSCRVLITR